MPTSEDAKPLSPPLSLTPSPVKTWTLAARPKTLWAAVAPVVVGTAMAWDDGVLHVASAFCALLGALLIQVGTNFSNDYIDFLKGADTGERKGPLRVTQAGLVSPRAMRRATFLTFALAFGVGLYLIWRGGWPILLIGGLSIVAGVLYTAGRHSLAYLGLGDLFVMLFFGPVAVGGTYYVQALDLTWGVLVAGLGPGLLSAALLMVNNLRDVEEDRAAKKKTLVVRFGRRFGIGLYVSSVVGAALVPVALCLATGAHYAALAASLVVLMAIPAFRTITRSQEARALNPVLGKTARLLLVYSLLFSAGWVI